MFDIVTMIGDFLLKEDESIIENHSPLILNTALYINLPLLYLFVSMMIFIFGDYSSMWYITSWEYIGVNIVEVKSNQTFIDLVGLLFFAGLFIATMGTNPGHELIHRKRKKFDMFVGYWLLALSWDCTFAIEHVYGHVHCARNGATQCTMPFSGPCLCSAVELCKAISRMCDDLVCNSVVLLAVQLVLCHAWALRAHIC